MRISQVVSNVVQQGDVQSKRTAVRVLGLHRVSVCRERIHGENPHRPRLVHLTSARLAYVVTVRARAESVPVQQAVGRDVGC